MEGSPVAAVATGGGAPTTGTPKRIYRAPEALPRAPQPPLRPYIFGAPDGERAPHRQGLPPHAAAAGLVVGQRPQRFAILFLLDGGWQMEELDFALNTIRVALDARLIDARVRGSFREAAESQRGLPGGG